MSSLFAVNAGDTASNPWFQQTKVSNAGLFVVTLDSAEAKAELNGFQDWLIKITDKKSGEAVSPARITVGGGMPMHGHGLPTQPVVTEYIGEGQYKVEGLMFNMHGQWLLEFDLVTADDSDKVVFEVVLDY